MSNNFMLLKPSAGNVSRATIC